MSLLLEPEYASVSLGQESLSCVERLANCTMVALGFLLAIPVPTVRCSIKILVISFDGWLLGIRPLWMRTGLYRFWGRDVHNQCNRNQSIDFDYYKSPHLILINYIDYIDYILIS